jgi:hypothetical protein
MTWRKKLNSRAYDPIATCSLSVAAPTTLPAQAITSADYTVVNDYYCFFNCTLDFQMSVATAIYFFLSLPLPFITSTTSRETVGYGYIYDATAGVDRAVIVSGYSDPNTCVIVPYEIDAGAGNVLINLVGGANSHKLRIAGQYPIR